MTPEGKVKNSINKVLDKYKGRVYKFMPVPGGFGPSSLDYILCVGGTFVAVEAKAPGKKPTPRQNAIIGAIKRAGGKVIIVDSTAIAFGSPLCQLDACLRRLIEEKE